MANEIKGMKELEAQLKKLGAAHGKKPMRKALRKVAKPIAQAAEDAAPVKSGRLKDSIYVSTRLNKSRAKQQRRQIGKHAVDLFIGSSGRHAHLIEFGTGKMPPRPFLSPAWDGGKDKMLNDLKVELWKDTLTALNKAGISTGDDDEDDD